MQVLGIRTWCPHLRKEHSVLQESQAYMSQVTLMPSLWLPLISNNKHLKFSKVS